MEHNRCFDPEADGLPASGSLLGAGTSVTISNLALKAEYHFAVAAVNAHGESMLSPVASGGNSPFSPSSRLTSTSCAWICLASDKEAPPRNG